jgi:endoglucanase
MTFACCLRTRALCAAFAAALTLMACGLLSASARAGFANAGVAGVPANNPLAGLRWGLYTSHDEVYPAYQAARGENRRLLGMIALQPRVRWFGDWYGDPEAAAREYIQNSTGGRADVLSQLAVFRLDPWEGAACQGLPTAAQQASYKQWIDAFAAGIGSARVALILQPDLPFEMCVPHHSQMPMQLVSYAARVFSALPHTSVYIDAGAADWPTVPEAVSMLRAAGVRYTRGFALNGTHYDSTQHEIMFGQKIVRALTAGRIPGRHFVINTSDNGRPFTYQQYHGPNFDNAAVCRTRASQRCVTLGIPPTTNVASPKWGLSAQARRVAGRLVDAYLWFGRPWLDNQADPFDLQRSLQLARTTPF